MKKRKVRWDEKEGKAECRAWSLPGDERLSALLSCAFRSAPAFGSRQVQGLTCDLLPLHFVCVAA